jgi:imidazolonepropionase-like amidohydrolase
MSSWPRPPALALPALLLLLPADSPTPPAASSLTVIEHVDLLPMNREGVIPDQTIAVSGGVIRSIVPAESYRPPDGALRIDGRGWFAMPGLADMHVHLYDDAGLVSYLAHGVTTIASLNGFPEVLQWRRSVASGARLGPTIYSTGPSINGNPPGNASFVSVETAAAARAAVIEQIRAGYDMVKVYSTLPVEAYDAVLAEARARKIAVMGHIPQLVSWRGVLARDGQSNIAHGEEFLNTATGGNPADTSMIPAIVEAARAAGVTVTANLFAYSDYLASIADLQATLRNPEMAYASPALLSEKLPAHNRSVRSNPQGFANFLRVGHAWIGKLTLALSRAGVPILVGTDTEIFGYPGQSAVAEIRELVQAGLTPYQALTAATRAPGEYVRRHVRPLDRFGTLEVGTRADLLLLRGNPLASLEHLEEVAGVMVCGHWLSASRLAELRDSIARTTSGQRMAATLIDSLALAGKVDEAVTQFRAMRARWPGVRPLAQVVLLQDGQRLFAGDPRGAIGLMTLAVETYPQSSSALSTRGRAFLAVGDTAWPGAIWPWPSGWSRPAPWSPT